MSKSGLEFSVGDHVVYPAHGVGQVQGIETQEVAGYSLEVYVITFDHEKMTLRVPTAKARGAGLRSLAEGLDRRLYGIWPDATHRERAMFQKLKEAYTKARYSKHYRISEEELTWLGKRVEELGRVVHQVCSDKIAELEAAVRR